MRSQRSHFNVRHMYPSLISFNPTSNFLSCEKQRFYLFCLSVNILFCLIRLVQLDNASKCAAAVAVVMMIADDSGLDSSHQKQRQIRFAILRLPPSVFLITLFNVQEKGGKNLRLICFRQICCCTISRGLPRSTNRNFPNAYGQSVFDITHQTSRYATRCYIQNFISF